MEAESRGGGYSADMREHGGGGVYGDGSAVSNRLYFLFFVGHHHTCTVRLEGWERVTIIFRFQRELYFFAMNPPLSRSS